MNILVRGYENAVFDCRLETILEVITSVVPYHPPEISGSS